MQGDQPVAAGVWKFESGKIDSLVLGTPAQVAQSSAALADRGDWPVSISVTVGPDGGERTACGTATCRGSCKRH